MLPARGNAGGDAVIIGFNCHSSGTSKKRKCIKEIMKNKRRGHRTITRQPAVPEPRMRCCGLREKE